MNKLLTDTFASGNFQVAPSSNDEAKDRLMDMLSCLARICGETAILVERLAACQVEGRGGNESVDQ